MADNRPLINLANSDLLSLDPASGQRMILDAMETGYNIRTIDASNPWALQLEASINTGIGIVEGYKNIEKRIYPVNAQTYDDLYRHMSDVDYITAFASPGKSTIDLFIRKDEILQLAVPVGSAGQRLMVIPKDSIINAGDYPLSIHNQINIIVSQSQGIRITWDMTTVSPLAPLASNEVLWDIRRNKDYEFIRIRIPVTQTNHNTRTLAVSASSGFSQHIAFTDQYYYTRIYHRINNTWVELLTTHSDQVYDITKPTAVIKVFENSFQVVIPTIYFTANLIGSHIRVDSFTTRGNIRVAINEYETNLFSGTFVDYDVETSVYIDAFNNLPTKTVLGASPISDGIDRIPFATLRDLVIMNAVGPQSLPITPAQLDRTGTINNYDIVKHVDNATNRIYLATRNINSDTARADGFAPLPVTMSTIRYTFNELTQYDSVTLSITADRVTLLPKTLYKNVNGITSIVNNAEYNELINFNVDQLSLALNNNTYLFSPYYYVLDTGENRFRVRAYDLDSPSVPTKNFVAINATTGIEVTAVSYSVTKSDTGFKVILGTESNDLFKEIITDDPTRFNCQLSFIPKGGIRTFMNAGLMRDVNDNVIVSSDGEYFIEFTIDSSYDVTESHGLYVNGFASVAQSPVIVATELVQTMDLVYIVDDVQVIDQSSSDIDLLINTSFLDDNAINHVGITHDQITIKFGDHLQRLWTRTHTSIAEDEYLTYDTNIVKLYPTNVYKYESSGAIEVNFDVASGTFKQTILHYAGDPELDTPITLTNTLSMAINTDSLKTSTNTFLASDVGKHVIIPGASTLGNGRHIATITEYISPTEIIIDSPITVGMTTGFSVIYGIANNEHSIGDNVLDINGNPISILLERDLDRETDLLMFDGAYYFATSETTTNYLKNTKNEITEWIVADITAINEMLLEQTIIYFYPKKMIGDIEVYTVDDIPATLPAKQSLVINVYVNTDTFKNLDLRTAIEQTLLEAINTEIRKQNISLDVFTDNLLTVVGNNVRAIKVLNLFDNKEHIVTLKNASYQFAIGKQLIGLSNGTIAVKDAITFQFLIHNGA